MSAVSPAPPGAGPRTPPPSPPGREADAETAVSPRARLLPFLGTGTLILLLILALHLSARLRDTLHEELTSRLRTAAQLVADAASREASRDLDPQESDLVDRVEEIRRATDVTEIVLYDREGGLLGGAARNPSVPRQIRLSHRVPSNRGNPQMRDPERDPGGGLTLVVPLGDEGPVGAVLTRIDKQGLGALAAVDLLFFTAKVLAGVVVAVGFLILLRWIARGAPAPAPRATPTLASSDVDMVLGTMKEVVTTLKDSEIEYRDRWTAAEEDAERHRMTNDLIIGSMTSGIVAFDSRGAITMFNGIAEDILEIAESRALGRPVEVVFGEKDRLSTLAADVLLEKTVRRTELRRIARDGVVRWLGVSSSVIRNSEGEGVGGIFLIADLTETKRLEEAMGLKDRLSAVGEMSAGIAHEIKNSLHSLMGFANLLREDFSGRESPLAVNGILSEVHSLEEMVHGVLEFSKPSNLLKEPALVSDVVAATIEAVRGPARRGSVEIHSVTDAELPAALLDEAAVKRAFVNLALNAIEAMAEGGKLTITARMAETREEGEFGAAIRVAFRDTGPGIAEADRARIFTPFYSTKRQGNGLGLALVHKTVTDHGGRIRLHSRTGVGTEFIVLLPVEAQAT